jgi:hypothetical protein
MSLYIIPIVDMRLRKGVKILPIGMAVTRHTRLVPVPGAASHLTRRIVHACPQATPLVITVGD